VRFWTFDKSSLETTLMMPLETRKPLPAAMADGRGGELSVEKTGLSVSRPSILLTAFDRNTDGGGTLLRLGERRGKSGLLQGSSAGGNQCYIPSADGPAR
jgi:hypothetical protein